MSYVTPKKNTAFIIYTALVSQADTKLLKSTPTLAAGDFKVSTDGAAFANLATLPTNMPGGVLVKVSLSAGEMNGDNISVACIDAAGAEWCDQLLNIQTSVRQVDDLAYPATSGRSIVVDASGLVDANTVKIGATGAGTAQTARDLGTSVLLSSGTGTGQVSLAAGKVTVGTNSDKTGYTVSTVSDKTGYSLSSAGIQALWDALTSALTTVGSIGKLLVTNIDATISSRGTSTYAGGAVASVTAGVTVTTNNDKTGYTASTVSDKTGYSISGTKTTLDALNDISSTDVLTQVNGALDAAGTELTSVPSTTGSIRQKLNYVFQKFRNKRTITATTETMFKEDTTTSLGTNTVADDGTTVTIGEAN